MRHTRVKICGVTQPADAVAAAQAGADAIGLVFYPPSPRAVDAAQARAIVDALPPFVCPVGLFLDGARADVAAVVEAVPLTLLQFHGREAAGFCEQFNRPYLKAVGMRSPADLETEARHHPQARALLADSCAPGQAGGTGEAFDWTCLGAERGYRLVLAGGLNPDNVAAAVTALRPDAVDVSTGVEAEPGRKDPERMQLFIEEVRRGDRTPA